SGGPSMRRIHPELKEAPSEKVDKPPPPGVPNFWASSEMGDDEDWVPPTRNRPKSSPWEERGKLEEAE
ncbi:MAG: hypothetical protein M1548_04565, partial [Actinobacteria bacterium]|nr:hypothetical protein [Actinomycetota bacterium]